MVGAGSTLPAIPGVATRGVGVVATAGGPCRPCGTGRSGLTCPSVSGACVVVAVLPASRGVCGGGDPSAVPSDACTGAAGVIARVSPDAGRKVPVSGPAGTETGGLTGSVVVGACGAAVPGGNADRKPCAGAVGREPSAGSVSRVPVAPDDVWDGTSAAPLFGPVPGGPDERDSDAAESLAARGVPSASSVRGRVESPCRPSGGFAATLRVAAEGGWTNPRRRASLAATPPASSGARCVPGAAVRGSGDRAAVRVALSWAAALR